MRNISLIRNKWMMPVVALAMLATSSCKEDEMADYHPLEVGGAKSEYIVPTVAGEVDVELYANSQFNISFDGEPSWASLSQTTMNGNGILKVSYRSNTSFPRMAKIVLSAENRTDTIRIKQEGSITPKLKLVKTNIVVDGKQGGDFMAEIETNLDIEDFKPTVTYISGEEDTWIGDMNLVNNKFVFNVKPNPTDKLRTANMVCKYVDGWEKEITETLFVTQSNMDGELGREVSFEELRRENGMIASDIYVYGIVISDEDSPNNGDLTRPTATQLDVTANNRTVYIQSLDGKYGLKIMTKAESDNIFRRNTKVQILLRNALISKHSNPNRYVISEVEARMVLSSEPVSPVQPKALYIEDLTDDDIYTYVKLLDCEIPMGEGCYTPINEGYCRGWTNSPAYRIDMYPLVVRDIKGGRIFMNTNVDCPWRRDGNPLPKGSGTITGIIVNEECGHFGVNPAKPTQSLSPSRYQIRALAQEDINLAPDFSNSFSQLIAEFRTYRNNGTHLFSNIGNATITTTGEFKNVISRWDYSWLGPLMTPLPGGKDPHKGSMDDDAWGMKQWWDYNTQTPNSWVINFSTKDIRTTQLSMQFTAVNFTCYGSPRYWVAEWSDHGDPAGEWKVIEEYTLPDLPDWSNTLLHQLPGLKNIDMNLPLEMLGKEDVYIRLHPTENKAGSNLYYDTKEIDEGAWSGMGYLAIRYNK